MWYHSHVREQRDYGLFGAFVIKERPVVNKQPTVSGDIMVITGDFGENVEYYKVIVSEFTAKTPSANVRHYVANTVP